MKIIVADDDETVRRLILRVFSRVGGHEIETVENGKELLDRWRESRHQLVISDIEMPLMTGVAACREIKRLDPSVKIVFVTASHETEHLREASLLGDRLDKPFLVEDLLVLALENA